MTNYYMNQNPQASGDHEVHREGCSWMPAPQNRRYLGSYMSCHDAVQDAKAIDPDADGCAHCSPECHTS